jgi:ATP-dependent helicase/nuclease subunit A
MNVHKAKGLEAKVVCLAFPTGEWNPLPTLHVQRDGNTALGFVKVEERAEAFTMRTLAQPLNWPELAAREAEYDRAEDVRLLYVAATRAAEELIVSRCYESEDKSPWRKLYPHFTDEQKGELEYKKPPARQKLELEAIDLQRRVAAVRDKRAIAAEQTYSTIGVKEIARKTVIGGESFDPLPVPTRADMAPRGIEWGTIVHSALEVAARGNDATRIQSACRGLLLEFERPLNPLTGEPAELDELLSLVAGVTRSDVYKRAMRSGNALVEVPFAAHEATEDATGLVDGVIDLAFKDKDGWVIVDYKTDVVADPHVWQQRTQSYKRQVDLYADYWEKLTGETVSERVLVLTSVGHELKWGKAGPVSAQQLDLGLA